MQIINGRKIAGEMIEKLKENPATGKYLGVILIGDDLASRAFIARKMKTAEEVSIGFKLIELSEEATTEDVKENIRALVEDDYCGGIILQLPVPIQINADEVCDMIPKEKDVDMIGCEALGDFYAGRSDGAPLAAEAMIEILVNHISKESGEDAHMSEVLKFISDKTVAVVGVGFLIGRPIATWFIKKCVNLHLLRKGSDLSILKSADIVILAASAAEIISAEMLKEGAMVIDFGYAKNGEGKVTGNFKAGEGDGKLACYTPTPGGTGPILVAKIFERFCRLNS